MAVQKCLDPWIFGSLDDYKIEKGCFLCMHKKQPFYCTFKSLCHYGCTKMLGSLDIWILG